ncbi:MAG: T9SS type A sorting domain-containing protein [bacterium]|nr:T9SS type A sorting domain-containing protein [bacterium]
MNMWVYHIQNYGAVVDSSYHLFLDFVPLAVETVRDVLPHDLHLTTYPNPFNSATQIEFALPSTQRLSLKLYDVLGREVAVLMNEIQTAGRHRFTFDASGLPSGVYLCRLEAGGMAQTRKIVLVK